jgi:hypothetical protein
MNKVARISFVAAAGSLIVGCIVVFGLHLFRLCLEESVTDFLRSDAGRTALISNLEKTQGSKKLSLAEISTTERFKRESAPRLFSLISLPAVAVQATMPVTYDFYIDLEEKWDAQLVKEKILITAPPLRMRLPTVDISKVQFDVLESHLLRDEHKVQEDLRLEITNLLTETGLQYKDKATQTAKRSFQNLVTAFLRTHFQTEKLPTVEVLFQGEELNINER